MILEHLAAEGAGASPAPTVDPNADDEHLMASIQRREEAALAQLHLRYRPLLRKIVAEILSNDADAEETLQDVFLEIWHRAASFDPARGKPLGWIIRMTRRRAIDHYRKIRVRAGVTEKLTVDARQQSPVSTATGLKAEEPQSTLPDLRQFLLSIVDALPAEQREVIKLNYFRQLSQREIAHFTGIPLGTIKTRLVLALRKLSQKSAPFREELYYA